MADAPESSTSSGSRPSRASRLARSKARGPGKADWATWAFTTVVLVVVGVAAVLGDGEPVGFWNGLVILVLATTGGWGAARWRRGLDAREETVGWIGTVALLWIIVVPVGGWLIDRLAPSLFWLGTFEALLTVPAVSVVVLLVARFFALHTTISLITAILAGLAYIGASAGDTGPSTFSVATPAQLLASRDSGDAVVVRGFDVRNELSSGVYDARRQAERETCEQLRYDRQRHTLIGTKATRFVVRFEACWSGDRQPSALTVTPTIESNFERSDARLVGLFPADPFELARGGRVPSNGDVDGPGATGGLRYGDRRSDLSKEPAPQHQDDPAFDRRGRLRADGDPSNDTILARVTEYGNGIEVIVAFESIDVARRSDGRPWSTTDDGSSTDDEPPVVPAGAHPARGVALDVVKARLYRTGGSHVDATRYLSGGDVDGGW